MWVVVFGWGGVEWAMMWSALFVQVKGWARSFQPSMYSPIASSRSLTLWKVPRRMACRVMIPKKISTMFNQDPLVGVKCRTIRGFFASRAWTLGCLWVA